MKLLIIGLHQNVDEATLKVACEKFAKIINGCSDPIVITEEDLEVKHKQKTEFEKIISDIITICGSPQKRMEFDAAFWNKFINGLNHDDTKVILNKIVDSCYNDVNARAYLRSINADRIFELCKLALGMIR